MLGIKYFFGIRIDGIFQPVYDPRFMKTVYEAPVLTVEELLSDSKPETKVVRLQYNNKDSFKSIAKILAIMEDIKVFELLMF